MTLSVGPATDALVTIANTAVTGITVAGKPVLVVDGWPDELAMGMFVIGINTPPPDPSGDTAGTRVWEGLGLNQTQEEYTIPAYIDVREAGETQKTARDAAESIFNAFWTAIKADRTLGGALGPGPSLLEVTDFTSRPSNIGTEGVPGRRQLITFGVRIRNRTT